MATIREWTGHESRCLRQAMRLSVRAFAEALGVSTRTVSKWEAGGPAARLRPDSHALLDTMLDRADPEAVERFTTLLTEAIPPDMLTGPPLGSRRRSGVELIPTQTLDGEAEQGAEDVERRRFLQLLAAAGLSGTSHPIAGLEHLRHELAQAVDGDIGEWDTIAWEYGCSYAATPPGQLLHDLALDVMVAREHLRRLPDGPARRDLQRAVARLAAFMAQTLSNLGDTRIGRRWWRMARQAAGASGSAEVGVWVRGREIVRGLYEGRPLDALLDLADEAMALSRQPGMGTGAVLAGRAQALAVAGRTDEARDAMADVYDMVEHLPPSITSDVESMYGWPESRLRHGESLVYTYIGDNQRAEAAQDRFLELYPESFFRERAQVQMHRALRMINDGDPASGVRHAVDSLAELPETQRIDPVLKLGQQVAAAVPAAAIGRADVLELRELVATRSG